MNSDWAAENLQVIRTLMERSALYRRALAPILLWLGLAGTAAGLAGPFAAEPLQRQFVWYWGGVGVASLGGCFLLARRQAIKDHEPFWSAPTRHVSHALLPPLLAGAVAGLLALAAPDSRAGAALAANLPAIWMVMYGCALSSAGFFMRRGMRALGWIFLALGSLALLAGVSVKGALDVQAQYAHYLMGATFGLLHLAAGAHLRISRDKDSEL